MTKRILEITQDAEDTVTNIIYQLNTDRINYRNNITRSLIIYQSKLICEYENRLKFNKEEELTLIDDNIKYFTIIISRLMELNNRGM